MRDKEWIQWKVSRSDNLSCLHSNHWQVPSLKEWNNVLFLHERIRLKKGSFSWNWSLTSFWMKWNKQCKLLYPRSSPYTTRVECLDLARVPFRWLEPYIPYPCAIRYKMGTLSGGSAASLAFDGLSQNFQAFKAKVCRLCDWEWFIIVIAAKMTWRWSLSTLVPCSD